MKTAAAAVLVMTFAYGGDERHLHTEKYEVESLSACHEAIQNGRFADRPLRGGTRLISAVCVGKEKGDD